MKAVDADVLASFDARSLAAAIFPPCGRRQLLVAFSDN